MIIFLRKLLFKKLFSFKVIYSICNTEETQRNSDFNISNLAIACYKETKYKIDCVSVIPIYFVVIRVSTRDAKFYATV